MLVHVCEKWGINVLMCVLEGGHKFAEVCAGNRA